MIHLKYYMIWYDKVWYNLPIFFTRMAQVVGDKYPFVLHSQHHSFWCSGDTGIQVISCRHTDLVPTNYSGLSTRSVNNAVKCDARFNAVFFSSKYSQHTPHSSPVGQDIGCLLWFQRHIYVLPLPMQYCARYRDISGRVMTALDSTVPPSKGDAVQHQPKSM